MTAVIEREKKAYEQQNGEVPKTVLCDICKREVPTVDELDENDEYCWTVDFCTESCEKVRQANYHKDLERYENRFIGTSKQYNKMVRKFAKLNREQRHTIYRAFSRATDLDHITFDQWDTDAWDGDGWAESCWEASDEAKLEYYRHDFIHWLVFDYDGEKALAGGIPDYRVSAVDTHPNAAGHAVIADTLMDYLEIQLELKSN